MATSMVEVAVEIFKEQKHELSFAELFALLEEKMGIKPSERQDKLVYFYSCISNDGRFLFDKATKKWGMISLLNPEVVKENRTGFDDVDDEDSKDKDDDDEIILAEEEFDEEDEEKPNKKKGEDSKEEQEEEF